MVESVTVNSLSIVSSSVIQTFNTAVSSTDVNDGEENATFASVEFTVNNIIL